MQPAITIISTDNFSGDYAFTQPDVELCVNRPGLAQCCMVVFCVIDIRSYQITSDALTETNLP